MTKDKSPYVYFDRQKKAFIGLRKADITNLSKLYKGVDIEKELFKMTAWLNSPVGQKRKGELSFICNWLERAQSAVAPESPSAQYADIDLSLRPFFDEYLKDLWKDRDHLLQFNQAQK